MYAMGQGVADDTFTSRAQSYMNNTEALSLNLGGKNFVRKTILGLSTEWIFLSLILLHTR